jgi:hypothetical protein
MSWFTTADVQHSSFPEGAALLVSGSPAFIDGALSRSGRRLRVVASALLKLHGSTVRGLRKDRAAAKDVMRCHGLTVILFLDAEIGGATDACFVIRFGADLGSFTLPQPVAGLPRALRHFVDGGTPGSFPPNSRVLQSSLPLLDNPPRKVLWHMDAVRGEGLFPHSRPLAHNTSSLGIGLGDCLLFQSCCGFINCRWLWTRCFGTSPHPASCLLRTPRPQTCLSQFSGSCGRMALRGGYRILQSPWRLPSP